MFVEVISSVWSSYTLTELILTTWSNSDWRLTFLHILKALPNLLTFSTCALEDLISHWIIWHDRFCFIYHLSFSQYWLILFIFSNYSYIFKALRNWEYIEESVTGLIRVFLQLPNLLGFHHVAIVYHLYVGFLCIYSIQIILWKTILESLFKIST